MEERPLLRIAITPDKPADELLPSLFQIENDIDGVILRLEWTEDQLYSLIHDLLNTGFNPDKLIIHSHVGLLRHFNLTHIHFRQGDGAAYQLKAAQPHLSISMAVHSAEACAEARQHQLDYGLYSHLFPTPSKPGLAPKSDEEMNAALAVGLPLIALGGITHETLPLIPQGFIGYAGIRLFENSNVQE